MINRRQFIQRSGAALAGTSLLGLEGFAQPAPYVTFDFHTHPGLFPAKGTPGYLGDAAVTKTISEMNSGKLTGSFFALVADMNLIQLGPTGVTTTGNYAPGDGWKEYKRQIAILKEIIETMPVTPAWKAADLSKAQQSGKTAAFISSEGGDFLEGRADRLDEMYADGVRCIQIVHYHPNELGDLQTADATHNGLSVAGKEVVRRMNKLKMLIDVAHAAEPTVKAVVDTTDAPILLSHSLLRGDENRPLVKRTLTPSHAKLVAQTKGVIGAWPSGYVNSFDEFLDAVRRLVDLVGVDHVGLGTDMDGNFKPVFSSYVQMPDWIEGLKKKGFREDEVRKIVGGNAQRVIQATIG